jgi:hypothetical protein
LIDCAAAGRVFGAPIGLPDWNKVLATPGHSSASSLDYELQDEMERVTHNIFWDSPESGLDRTNNDFFLLRDLVATMGARKACAKAYASLHCARAPGRGWP